MALRKSVSPSPHFIAMIRTMTMISMAGAAVAAPPPPVSHAAQVSAHYAHATQRNAAVSADALLFPATAMY